MYTGSLFELSIEEMIEELKKRENDIKKENKKSKKSNFKFYEIEMKSHYWTYRSYLAARCSSLPSQLERKFKNCYAWHKESTCYGMSNYIEISNEDSSITIRISDHNQTSSGSPCDYYIYIQNKTWMEIKKEVFEIAENFLK